MHRKLDANIFHLQSADIPERDHLIARTQGQQWEWHPSGERQLW